MKTSFQRILLVILLSGLTFAGGWFAARSFYAGELAMGALIEVVSAIGYLERDDKENAVKLLLLSAEGNVVRVAEYGTPVLDWYEPEAKKRWFQRYAKIRSAHQPVDYPDGGQFEKKVEESLSRLNGP